jgi:hypothetical protein
MGKVAAGPWPRGGTRAFSDSIVLVAPMIDLISVSKARNGTAWLILQRATN